MKLNRKRIDVRLPQWLLKKLREHAEERGWTLTQTLELTATKGLKWYQKELEKMKNPGYQRQSQCNPDLERCPTSEDNNNIEEQIRIAKAKWVETD